MQSLSGNLPEDAEQATLAYAEGASMVGFFVQHYGQNKLATLIAAYRQGATSDEAFRHAVGTTTLGFQQE